jgi:hypothetical protein
VFETRELKILGSKREEIGGRWKKYIMRNFVNGNHYG